MSKKNISIGLKINWSRRAEDTIQFFLEEDSKYYEHLARWFCDQCVETPLEPVNDKRRNMILVEALHKTISVWRENECYNIDGIYNQAKFQDMFTQAVNECINK